MSKSVAILNGCTRKSGNTSALAAAFAMMSALERENKRDSYQSS